MSKAPSEMRRVCMYANFEAPQNYEEMNLVTSRAASRQSTCSSSKSSTKGSYSGGVVRKRVSFHEDVKASKDSYYNNLDDIGEMGNRSQSEKILQTASSQRELPYHSTTWATYPKIFLVISLIAAGFGSCLWNRTQHHASQLVGDSNNTVTNHDNSARIPTAAIDKELISQELDDFQALSSKFSSKERQDNDLQSASEIAIINDASKSIKPVLNAYEHDPKPLLQHRATSIHTVKQEENTPQQDSLLESDGRSVQERQNEINLLLPKKVNMKNDRIQETITSQQCSIKCLVTFAFLNARTHCHGCNRNNKNLNWTNTLDSLFME
jgi:hypothetical protein